MPNKCCIAGCKNSEKETDAICFPFPNEENLRNQWLKAIRLERKPLKLTKTSKICIDHFAKNQVLQQKVINLSDGQQVICDLKIPILAEGAIPEIFPCNPLQIINENRIESRIGTDDINSFEDFLSYFIFKISDYAFKVYDSFILFYKLNMQNCPKIIRSCKVFQDLKVTAYFMTYVIPESNLEEFLGNDLKCKKWSDFTKLLHFLDSLKLIVVS